MTNKRDIDLAQSLLDQCEELIEDFIRDNVDMDLDPDDMYEQFETCRQYIRENLFRDNRISLQDMYQGVLK